MTRTIRESLSKIGESVKDEISEHGGVRELGREALGDIKEKSRTITSKATEKVHSFTQSYDKSNDDVKKERNTKKLELENKLLKYLVESQRATIRHQNDILHINNLLQGDNERKNGDKQ